MIKNYFKIACRNIARHKVFSFINIAGLTLGLCACIVIYLIASYEFSFDNFHPGKDRIYRVMGDVTESTGDKLHFARVPPAISVNDKNNLPGLEQIAAIIPYNTKIDIGVIDGDQNFDTKLAGTNYITTAITEPEYFSIFRYKWLAGNPAVALNSPSSVVLTEDRARQYFGPIAVDKILGKEIIYGDSLITHVTGVVKDWDRNSDLLFTDFISLGTIQSSFLKNIFSLNDWKQTGMSAWVFAKTKKGVSAATVNDQMSASVKRSAGSETKLALWLEPISEIHFNADVIENPIRVADKTTLYILMAIALFVLILAVINFINLSTAQSIRRSKEAGIRKVLGSNKANLILQFLSETFVITLLSVTLAVLLVDPVLNLFRSFIPAGISFHLAAPSTILFLLGIAIVTSLLAGWYPAKVLSSYLPAMNLSGAGNYKGGRNWILRKGLIVFQFSVSLVFITGSIIIAKQLDYTRSKYPGFTSDAIIIVETPREGPVKTANLAEQVKQVSGVQNVAMQWTAPMTDNPRGMKLKLKSTDVKDFQVTQVAGNENFIPLYKIKMLAGRNLVRSDSVNEFVINETLSLLLGNKSPQDAIGTTLYWNDKPYPVVGVVADFHTTSFHEAVTPLCIINRKDRLGGIAIKLASAGKGTGMIKNILAQLERKWKTVYPASAFNYRFYDESLAMLYKKDQQTAWLINSATSVTIFISCIGLLGLALFTARRKEKEIGIRKTLGASTADIVARLSKEFIVLIVVAFLVASPVAWYLADGWLQSFVYRTSISWWIFLLAGSITTFIALLTISSQAIKAAMANPVKSLRTE